MSGRNKSDLIVLRDEENVRASSVTTRVGNHLAIRNNQAEGLDESPWLIGATRVKEIRVDRDLNPVLLNESFAVQASGLVGFFLIGARSRNKTNIGILQIHPDSRYLLQTGFFRVRFALGHFDALEKRFPGLDCDLGKAR